MVTGHFWVNPSVARPTQSGARHPSAEASPLGWPGSADVNLYGQVLNCLSDGRLSRSVGFTPGMGGRPGILEWARAKPGSGLPVAHRLIPLT